MEHLQRAAAAEARGYGVGRHDLAIAGAPKFVARGVDFAGEGIAEKPPVKGLDRAAEDEGLGFPQTLRPDDAAPDREAGFGDTAGIVQQQQPGRRRSHSG